MKQKSRTFSWSLLTQMPIVGILRNIPSETIPQILPGYIAAGLSTLEITMNSPGATEMINGLSKSYGETLNVGAGTVRNLADLELAINAGANFIVTPILDEEVIRECVRLNIPIFPGAYTPTEIYKAWRLGASIVKIFPATSLGPGYFKDILAPLNDIKIMPTGGVSLSTLPGFFEAGATAFGIGSPMFDKELIQNKDWDNLGAHFLKFSDLLNHLRSPR
jgi:2-dehydro-3-deoxyphosphogluconate aldolase/(4S)-4-hydroxy-2-oxoglutarate aldolase